MHRGRESDFPVHFATEDEGPADRPEPTFEAAEMETIAAWSDKAEALAGWTAREVRGEKVADRLIAPADRVRYAEWARSARDGVAGSELAEFTVLHRDGRQFRALFKRLGTAASGAGSVHRLSLRALGDSLLASQTPKRGTTGAGDRRTLELADINHRLKAEILERERVEAALYREKEFLVAILNNLEDGIVACDARGMLTVFNRATREFHGLDDASIPPEQWPGHYDLYLPDGTTPMKKGELPLFRALRGEVVQNAELVVVPKHRPTRRLLANGQAIFDAEGKKVGAIVTLHDITQRRIAEEELRRQQFLLQYIINFVPHAVFWKDRDDRLLGGNRSFLIDALGVDSVEKMIGKTDYDFFPTEQAEYFRKCDFAVMQSEQPMLDIEEPQSQWEKGDRTLLTSKVPLRDESGAVIGLLGSFVDITDRKRMEQELEQAKRAAEAAAHAKSEFLTTVSHEFRTPLTLMLGPLDLLLSSPEEPLSPRLRLSLERIQRNARRLHRLVDDILDHQKIEAGKMDVEWEAVDLIQLGADLAADAQQVAERAGIELSIHADKELSAVPLDRRKFEKIMLNLLGNALKFTPSGGRIAVELSASKEHFELSVEDTGPGIPEEKRHLLFQRFQQVDTSATRKHEGTGIGLSLVKELSELMGGTVTVQSELGKGSRFFVRLPRAADRLVPSVRSEVRSASHFTERLPASAESGSAAPLPAAHDGPGAAGAHSSRVLVVEDNADMRSYLAEILGSEHEVELATNGREALMAARSARPDVIVSDVMMPEMDGFELVDRLKRDPSLRDVPIILLTARAGRAAVVVGLEGGADDYLGKPFDPAELRARVRAAMRLHRAYLELAAKNRELEATLQKLSKTQDELVQAGKLAAVGTLIAGLSHELNNPVAAISMHSQLLLRKKRAGEGSIDEATLEKALLVIDAQAKRCAALVRTLLDYTRRKATGREPCDVRAALERALEISAPQARQRGVTVEVRSGAGGLPAVLVSPAELDSALLNVIGNAIDAGAGAVVVEARPRASGLTPGVELEVRDDGCGIGREDLPRIFEPFFTTKPPGRGTGLGLSLTRRFFDEHGGEIRIDSEPGKGTTVVMWLPAMAPEAGDGSSDGA
jgi:PAS domain S-box-containing protein